MNLHLGGFDDFEDDGAQKKTRVGRLKTPADVAAYIARCIRASEQAGANVEKELVRVKMAKELLRALQATARANEYERRSRNNLTLDLPPIDGIDD